MKNYYTGENHICSYKILIDSGLWSCEANLVSCSRIYRYLIENGHEITYDASQADFIIINSCGVVKGVVDRCLHLFHTYTSLKKKEAIIIMFGCLVKIDRELLAPLDLLLIGPDESNKLDEYFFTKFKFETIAPYCDDETKLTLISEKSQFDFYETIPFGVSKLLSRLSTRFRLNYNQIIKSVTYQNRIFISIAQGCLGNCSYCVIKKAKGKIKSRKIIDILSDIKQDNNTSKTVHLVADDCGCYGYDIGTNLFELLYKIQKEFPELSIDLNNLNPNWLEDSPKEYVKLFRDININFVKIPFQSGSDKIIKNMNRNYNVKKVQRIISRIKKVSPKTLIMTHFIIGYPGEDTIDFIKSISASKYFDYPLPFKYSKNKGTISSTLPNQKSELIISIRYTIFLLYLNIYLLIKLFTSSNPKNN
jgi:MiaB/RimO family radical SAM methylthiotransferase